MQKLSESDDLNTAFRIKLINIPQIYVDLQTDLSFIDFGETYSRYMLINIPPKCGFFNISQEC